MSIQGYIDVHLHVCASVWVAAGGYVLDLHRLYICAWVRVWARSCQDRAAIVPRPVFSLSATLHYLAGPGSMKGALCSCPSCSALIHLRGLLKVEKVHSIPPFLPMNRALLSRPRAGQLRPSS